VTTFVYVYFLVCQHAYVNASMFACISVY